MYDLEEYLGELYRMNLSYSGGGLPESGCLFFKVVGKSYVTNGKNMRILLSCIYRSFYCITAKFNCTVPGTLYDFTEECSIATVTMVTTPNEITSTVTAVITTVAALTRASFHRPINSSMSTAVDSTTVILISVMASVIGDIAVILTICLLIVCVVIRFKKGQLNTLSTTTVSESRSHTDMERPQAINPLPGIQCQCHSLHVTYLYMSY